MNKAGRIIMTLGIMSLLLGGLVNDLVGLSSFWHNIGYGIALVVGPMFVLDVIKHHDQYFG